MTNPTPQAFSLDHVRARNVPIHWDEAVAVVEELCRLLTAGAEDRRVPDLGDILITADGSVVLQGRSGGTTGPNGVGRTLHALLSTADVPVSLRLFVTQATSLNTYASLGECAAALAYFGKPDRADLIRAVYERCVAVGAGTTPARELAPIPDAVKPQADNSRRRPAIPTWVVMAASAACVFAAVLGLWFAVNRTGATAGTVPALAAQTKNALQRLGTEVRSALGVAQAAAPAQPEPDKAVTPPAQVSGPRVARPRQDSRRAIVTFNETVRAPLFSLPPVVFAAGAPADLEPSASALSADRVYTLSDLDVQPPLLIYPQLPPQLITGSQSGAVNTMEIVVSEIGTVLRVRLINGPRRMPDMMLLSGAKNWKFTPAVKDGDPVRYLTVVSWLAGP